MSEAKDPLSFLRRKFEPVTLLDDDAYVSFFPFYKEDNFPTERQWAQMETINRFNVAFEEVDRKPEETMPYFAEKYPDMFEISMRCESDDHFTTTLKMPHFRHFIGKGSTGVKSLEDAYHRLFTRLQCLSKLFAYFKTVKVFKSPEKIMEDLLANYDQVLELIVEPNGLESAFFAKMKLVGIHLASTVVRKIYLPRRTVRSPENTEKEAKELVFGLMFRFLSKLSLKYVAPKSFLPEQFRSCLDAPELLVGPLDWTDFEKIHLLNAFNEVFDRNSSIQLNMEMLRKRMPEEFNVETCMGVTIPRHRQFTTKFRLFSITTEAFGPSVRLSKSIALKKAFIILATISRLLAHFKMIYLTKSPSDVIFALSRFNSIFRIVYFPSLTEFTITITIGELRTFTVTRENKRIADNEISQTVYDYLKNVLQRVRLSPDVGKMPIN